MTRAKPSKSIEWSSLQSWFEAGRMIHRAMVRLTAERRTEADLDAIVAGDADTAERFIDAHLSLAREGLRQALTRWEDRLSQISLSESE
jgi:DNA-binding GntR family transcriptional regulator